GRGVSWSAGPCGNNTQPRWSASFSSGCWSCLPATGQSSKIGWVRFLGALALNFAGALSHLKLHWSLWLSLGSRPEHLLCHAWASPLRTWAIMWWKTAVPAVLISLPQRHVFLM